ncbi:hypothetical protein [Roseibium sp.]|uniref:VHL beta domain-containing protein n=1 Tax=Roseibium sp. TaxID=1936156 RepID=UPI003A9787ED
MPRPAVGLYPAVLAGLVNFVLLSGLSVALAQTPPETLRINVEPAKPGIRSITIDKKYRPIISRDDAGVVIDTMGSASSLPPCEVQLEVTLENSRVLHRSADICSGDTLVVDVASDGKPGSARIVGTSGSAVSAQRTPAAPAATTLTQTQPSTTLAPVEAPENNGLDPVSGQSNRADPATADAPAPQEESVLKPLERVDIDGGQPGNNDLGATPDQFGNGISGQNGFLVSPSEDRVWNTTTGFGANSRTDLTHGVPETDDIDFRAACLSQSGQATLVFSQTSPSVSEGISETVNVSAGDFSASYSAIGGSTNNQYGQSFPQVVLPMTDPLWQALIAQSELTVQVAGIAPYTVSLKGSAQPVRLFIATCAQPQTIIGEDGGLNGAGQVIAANSDVSCGEIGRITSLEGTRPGQIVFRNTSQEAVDIHWIDYNGGERVYARLQPGQLLDQQTFVSHAWLVRSAAGQCLGIYVTRTPYREVVISGGGQATETQQPGFGLPTETLPAGPIPPGSIGDRPSDRGGWDQSSFSPDRQAVNYLCSAGVDLNVSFSPDGSTATVAEMGFGVFTLTRIGSPSSFHYEAQGYVLKGQIANTTWSRPGLRDVFCAAQ